MNPFFLRSPATADLNRLSLDNATYSQDLKEIPKSHWPPMPVLGDKPDKVWRSRTVFVMGFIYEKAGMRLSATRTEWDSGQKRFKEGFSWDELQEVKRQCGYADYDAVEIYPADRDVVNVANMRHLWVLPEALDFKWKSEKKS